MVRVIRGRLHSLAEIAEMHWVQINPKRQDGMFYERALVRRVTDLYDEHFTAGRYNHAQYYGELIANSYELLKALIICTPDDMPGMIVIMNRLLVAYGLTTSSANPADFGYELLHRAFQYGNWRDGGSSHLLFNWLGIEVCPYCNWAPVYKDEINGNLVVTFDHFYDKASYPYFSLSFYNLIPSCQVCNLTYKNANPFTMDSHLHPYLDCYNQRNKFNHNYQEDAVSYRVFIEHDATDIRSEQYNADLGLSVRYNLDQVKEQAEIQYQLSQLYPPHKKIDLVNDWRLLDRYEVEREICRKFKIPFQKVEILNRLFGKMKRDFALKSQLISQDNPLISV